MFGSSCFMLDGKMCACARADALLCRLRPADAEDAVARGLGRPMLVRGRESRSYVTLDEELLPDDVLREWLDRAVAFTRELAAG